MPISLANDNLKFLDELDYTEAKDWGVEYRQCLNQNLSNFGFEYDTSEYFKSIKVSDNLSIKADKFSIDDEELLEIPQNDSQGILNNERNKDNKLICVTDDQDNNKIDENYSAYKTTILSNQINTPKHDELNQLNFGTMNSNWSMNNNYLTTFENDTDKSFYKTTARENGNNETYVKENSINSKINHNSTTQNTVNENQHYEMIQDLMISDVATKNNLMTEKIGNSCNPKQSNRKYGNERSLNLAIRKDVINKTVLRIMRRFFTQKFRNMFTKKFKSKEAKINWYYEYVKKFTVRIFGSAHSNLKELQTYMASIINPKHMKATDIEQTGLEKEQFYTFHNCLYKYSHTRLVNLFKIQPIGILYDYFYSRLTEDIIKMEPSVSKNSWIYYSAFRDFLGVFEGTTDVSVLILN